MSRTYRVPEEAPDSGAVMGQDAQVMLQRQAGTTGVDP